MKIKFDTLLEAWAPDTRRPGVRSRKARPVAWVIMVDFDGFLSKAEIGKKFDWKKNVTNDLADAMILSLDQAQPLRDELADRFPEHQFIMRKPERWEMRDAGVAY